MRRESTNPVSGKRHSGIYYVILEIVFFVFCTAAFSLAAWSYYSVLASGGFAATTQKGERLLLWMGQIFITPLCAPSAELWLFIKTLLPTLLLLSAFASLSLLLISGAFRRGNFADVEYGSAHWARGKELKPFRNAANNMPLADKIYLAPEASPANKNVFVLASPGGGKTFTVIIPAIEAVTRPGYPQGSFFCTDTKGALYRETVHMLRDKRGYPTYLLNLSDPWHSNQYNPLANVHEERKYTEIASLALACAQNARDEDASVGDNIWEATFQALIAAVWFYQYDYAVNPVTRRPETRAMWRTAELILSVKMNDAGHIDESGEMAKIVSCLKATDPLHPAVRNFEFVTAGAVETVSSVIFTAGSKIDKFLYPEIECLMRDNEIPLDRICEEPSGVYLNFGTNSPYKMIAAMFIDQLISSAYYIAETRHNGKLPIDLKLMLDELPNICRVQNLPKIASTSRSYGIDIVISVQSMQQLKRLFKDQEQTLMNNCATHIYLGSSEQDALKQISELLGKTTTEEVNMTRQKGMSAKGGGSSEGERGLGRELVLPAEITSMPDKYSIVKMQHHQPIFAHKYKTASAAFYGELGGRGCPENNRPIEADYDALRKLHIAEYNKECGDRIAALKGAPQ